jgi:hypothetical protein
MEDKKPSLEKWNDFAGDYLKADLVHEFPVTLVPIGIDSEFKDGKPLMTLDVEFDGKKWKLNLNKTNQNFIRALGLMPREVIGRKLIFDLVKNRNPQTGKAVDSFELIKID